jgi:hypothetical protein
MANNDDKILPVLRWLLIAFFGLLLVLAVQLFLLVKRANAAPSIKEPVHTELFRHPGFSWEAQSDVKNPT